MQANYSATKIIITIDITFLTFSCFQEEPKAYKCGSNPKGLVLILNIHDYQEREDPNERMREGSQYDRRDLTELFDQLGYDPIVYPENISDLVTEKVSFS
jgi:hypothetical protein